MNTFLQTLSFLLAYREDSKVLVIGNSPHDGICELLADKEQIDSQNIDYCYVTYCDGSSELHLPYPSNQFDAVILYVDLIQFTHSARKTVVAAARRVMVDNGLIMVMVVNPLGIHIRNKTNARTLLKFRSPKYYESLLFTAGFNNPRALIAIPDFYTPRWLVDSTWRHSRRFFRANLADTRQCRRAFKRLVIELGLNRLIEPYILVVARG